MGASLLSLAARARHIASITLGMSVALAATARALDLTNLWAVTLFTDTCNWTITQTGTSLTFNSGGNCDYLASGVGTVDSATGAFTAEGRLSGFNPPFAAGIQISAIVAPSGRTFTGSATIVPGPVGPISGTLCGNGAVDTDEQCDDGGNPVGCCTDTCASEPDGQTCTVFADRQCATGRTCSAGTCRGAPEPAGTPCDADNEPCTLDACDGAGACVQSACSPCCNVACTGLLLRTDCAGPGSSGSKVRLKTALPDKRDRLLFRMPGAEGPEATNFGDPTGATDYTLCMVRADEDYGLRLLLTVRAPAGGTCGTRPCWKAAESGFRYSDPERTPDGLATVRLKVKDGRAVIRVVGRGPNVSPADVPITFPYLDSLWVQLRTADSCWGAYYPTPDVLDVGLIEARGGD